MSTSTFVPTEPPPSSGEIRTINPDRIENIDNKHKLVGEFLKDHGCNALLLQKASNFSWFTTGGDMTRRGTVETVGSLFITPEARVLIAGNADSGQLFDCELPGVGFQLKERPWHEPRSVLIEDICRGRTVASDSGFNRTTDVSVHLQGMRVRLTDYECERMRELGKVVTHALEATARNFKHRETEAEIAGQLAHRLIRNGVTPERIQVLADGQGHRYRHWSYGEDRVERYCVIAAIGCREGLHVGACRTVCFGDPPKIIRMGHVSASLIQATGMFFSQADWEIFETWKRVHRIYEKFGYPDEWQLAEQAEIVGYEPAEIPYVTNSEFRQEAGMAVHWHPSVGPAMVGDTILITDTGFELLTPSENWPNLTIDVKGVAMTRPDILRRKIE